MGIPVWVPGGMAERKPRHGEPCNRCGLCCTMTLCDVARTVFRRPEKPAYGPCPALRLREGIPGEHECGLACEPGKYGEAARLLIWAGQGCDARINGEPINEAF